VCHRGRENLWRRTKRTKAEIETGTPPNKQQTGSHDKPRRIGAAFAAIEKRILAKRSGAKQGDAEPNDGCRIGAFIFAGFSRSCLDLMNRRNVRFEAW